MNFQELRDEYKPRTDNGIRKFNLEVELGNQELYDYVLKLEKNPKKIICIETMVYQPEKTQGEIAKDLKITEKTICEWKKEKCFSEILSHELSKTWETRRSEVLNKMFEKALSGDMRACALFLKSTAKA